MSREIQLTIYVSIGRLDIWCTDSQKPALMKYEDDIRKSVAEAEKTLQYGDRKRVLISKIKQGVYNVTEKLACNYLCVSCSVETSLWRKYQTPEQASMNLDGIPWYWRN